MPKKVTQREIDQIIKLKDEEKLPFKIISKKIGLCVETVRQTYHRYKPSRGKETQSESLTSTIEQDPQVIKLRIEVRKAELQRKIREAELPFEVEKELKEINETIEKLIDQITTPTMFDRLMQYKCEKCGARGKVAIPFKCTNCGEEGWWGRLT